MSEHIFYSTSAKAHDLALANLKSQNLSNLSPKEYATKYLEVYSEILEVLKNDKTSKNKTSVLK